MTKQFRKIPPGAANTIETSLHALEASRFTIPFPPWFSSNFFHSIFSKKQTKLFIAWAGNADGRRLLSRAVGCLVMVVDVLPFSQAIGLHKTADKTMTLLAIHMSRLGMEIVVCHLETFNNIMCEWLRFIFSCCRQHGTLVWDVVGEAFQWGLDVWLAGNLFKANIEIFVFCRR